MFTKVFRSKPRNYVYGMKCQSICNDHPGNKGISYERNQYDACCLLRWYILVVPKSLSTKIAQLYSCVKIPNLSTFAVVYKKIYVVRSRKKILASMFRPTRLTYHIPILTRHKDIKLHTAVKQQLRFDIVSDSRIVGGAGTN